MTSLTDITLYGLIGLFFLMAALSVLLFSRLRRRYLRKRVWQGDICPRCRNNIRRVHRTGLDRVWGALMFEPLRRYGCIDEACGWTGLLYGKPHKHHHDPTGIQSIEGVAE
jgi:hypothetical protein